MKTRVLLFLFCAVTAGHAATSVPRPEFPQPQFERPQWRTLNGVWHFDFDDENVGIDKNWSAPMHQLSRQITVPFCFESKLSGIGDTAFHPWVWYSREFRLPADWKGRRVLLHFGAVDYRSQVWVNGRFAGGHEGGNTPFQFDITSLLDGDSNVLTVRAEDPPTDRYIPRGKQYWEVKSKSIFYTRTSGIWQPVWLESTGESYLERVRLTPTIDGLVIMEAEVGRSQAGLEFSAVIGKKNMQIASGTSLVHNTRSRLALAVSQPLLWSVNDPQLYDVTFQLRKNGVVLDTVTSYFGFRKISTEGGQVMLNNNRIYLKLILDQGYWRDSILSPPSDEAIQYDIRTSKEMGFNGARKHQKLEDPRFLYWADKMGYLVSSEMANAYLFDAAAAGRFTREWTEAVTRDYNHPSIVIWVPINESWGVPDLQDPRQQQYLKGLYALTHTLDSARLVIDNDGWEHTNSTDLFAIHDYARNGELLYERYQVMGEKPATVPNNHKKALISGYQYNGSPIYLSEFGGIAFIPPGATVPPESWGYSGVEKTPADALARLTGIYQSIAKLPALAGFCYTQLTDVEQEVNGLLTFDRVPKFDIKTIKAINDLVH
ncbi:MAG TPA: glycoside hydrolase family 2 TIM barrel-domain containing protein [Candidatus Dormibacteraeota bacterium]|nr:glycoside hydrolase family 2 TIM barrel-domain containing protein [Candidatus Dormibacteraeota bacterium]